jgi:hypothetical protein
MDEATSSLDTSAESIEKVIDDFKLKENHHRYCAPFEYHR